MASEVWANTGSYSRLYVPDPRERHVFSTKMSEWLNDSINGLSQGSDHAWDCLSPQPVLICFTWLLHDHGNDFQNITSYYNGPSCTGTHEFAIQCPLQLHNSGLWKWLAKRVNSYEKLSKFDAACDVGELCCPVSSLSYSSTAASHSRNHFWACAWGQKLEPDLPHSRRYQGSGSSLWQAAGSCRRFEWHAWCMGDGCMPQRQLMVLRLHTGTILLQSKA